MTEWITADTHFGHGNITTYCGRPQDSEQRMFSAWEQTVAPRDRVWHLGDVFLPQRSTTGWYMDRISALPGRKCLIRGNHDRGRGHTVAQFNQMGFDVMKPVWFEWRGFLIVLTHKPYVGRDYFDLNIHGHIHDKVSYPPNATGGQYRNVSVEVTDYTPVNLEDILRGMLGAP